MNRPGMMMGGGPGMMIKSKPQDQSGNLPVEGRFPPLDGVTE
jgi:hypothetical protein